VRRSRLAGEWAPSPAQGAMTPSLASQLLQRVMASFEEKQKI